MASTSIIITNASGTQLSLVGDEGKTRVDISASAGSNTATIDINDVLGNELLCNTLSSWVTSGNITVTRGGVAVTAAQLSAYAFGADMDRVDYDSDDDTIADAAEALSDGTTTVTVAQVIAGYTGSSTLVDVATYTALATDSMLVCDGATAASQIDIALPAGVVGKSFEILDSVGDADTHDIVITPNLTDTIDGVNAAITIGVNFGSVKLFCPVVNTWVRVNVLSTETAPAAIGSVSPGVSSIPANEDHVHAHGDLLGGTFHADAVAGVSDGFMSAAQATAAVANTAAAVHNSLEVFGHADLTAAAGTETLTFAVALPGTAIVLGAYLRVTEAFDNVGVTATTTCDVGLTASDEFLNAAAIDAIAVVGTPVGTTPMLMSFGGVSITVKVDSDVNVDTLTTGSMSVNVVYIEAGEAIV